MKNSSQVFSAQTTTSKPLLQVKLEKGVKKLDEVHVSCAPQALAHASTEQMEQHPSPHRNSVKLAPTNACVDINKLST